MASVTSTFPEAVVAAGISGGGTRVAGAAIDGGAEAVDTIKGDDNNAANPPGTVGSEGVNGSPPVRGIGTVMASYM